MRSGILFFAAFVLVAQEKPAADPADGKVEPVRTAITVVESVTAESPAAISVVSNREIRETPGLNIDDRLRQIPGFSLFRRSSSLVAHPTTQGVSLRGIGSSGASRSLVLWDGIPANDPFGGWVYWTRFAPDELERVEVSRGASTSVFGDKALGGAIALFSRTPEHRRLYGRYEGGSQNTHDAGAGYSHAFGRFALTGEGRAYTTDGYYIVPETIRGPVDTLAGVRFVSGNVRADWLGSTQRFFFKSDILSEERMNGTPIQTNSTGLGQISLHYHGERGDQAWSVLGYHAREEFRSAFSSIAATRLTESPTFRQQVPAESTGGAAMWGVNRSNWSILAGGDAVRTEGYSNDRFATFTRVGGGTLTQKGVFGQVNATAGPARFFVGARENGAGDGRNFFSPSGGLTVGAGRFRGRGTVYRAFRVPTLNELYRQFSAGNATTLANPALRPETLFGAEFGGDFVGERSRARLTFYRNDIRDIVTNVTIASSGNQITRQRQNAARVLSRGMEFDASSRWRNFRGEVGYLYVDSRFSTGERVPQIPKHQGSAQLSFDRGGFLASAGVRSFAAQFEDDRNLFVLPGFATLQVVARQRLTPKLSAIAAFENLLDRQVLTAISPTPAIGAPRLWRIGLRWEGKL